MKFLLTRLILICSFSIRAQIDTTQIHKTDSAVYYRPEIEAEFPGGPTAWMHYLVKYLRYPEKAQNRNIQGQVVLRFMIDSTGLAHDVTAISGPVELLEESVRLIENVGLWSPAIMYGRKVNAWKIQKINFRLESQ